MIWWFRSEPPVTGPPPKDNVFRWNPSHFSLCERQYIDKVCDDLGKYRQHKVFLNTENPCAEEHLYLRAFVAYLLIHYVEVHSYDDSGDLVFCKNVHEELTVCLDGVDVRIMFGSGVGCEYADERLQLGEFRYYTLEMNEPEDPEDPFSPCLCSMKENFGENVPIRMYLGPGTSEHKIGGHYRATGVTHHAYKNGHPINSTVDGYEKVPDKTVKKIDVAGAQNMILGNLVKMSRDVKEHCKNNDVILDKMKNHAR